MLSEQQEGISLSGSMMPSDIRPNNWSCNSNTGLYLYIVVKVQGQGQQMALPLLFALYAYFC
jgi:hypothetical protein